MLIGTQSFNVTFGTVKSAWVTETHACCVECNNQPVNCVSVPTVYYLLRGMHVHINYTVN